MARLAEKIRNTQPWCAALLRAPQIAPGIEQNKAGSPMLRYKPYSVPVTMPWEPGFVVQFPGIKLADFYAPDAPFIEEVCDKAEEHLVLTARRRSSSRDIELEIWCCRGTEEMPIGTATVQEGRSLGKVHFNYDEEAWKETSKREGAEKVQGFRRFRAALATSMLATTLHLLQCKNVTLAEHKNPPKKRGKARSKRQVESYWVLDIPGSPRYWDKSSTGHTGIHSRLHVVRGHFKTYTEEAPLFGRVTGTIWVPCHARGDAQLGLIEKDYNLVDDQGGRDVA